MADELKAAVIGGGYAGMAAAVELATRGIPVTVFESAKQLGGRARGVHFNDTQLDNGQHLLLGCYRETLRLIEQVGGNVERDFLRLPLQLDLHRHLALRAPRLPAPLHLFAALFTARGLSWNERLAAARFMLRLRAMQFRLAQDMPVVELLHRQHQDANLVSKLWEPLTLAALNTPIDQASAQVLLNVLRDALNRERADSDMLLPRIDLTALFPQRAAAYIERHGGSVRPRRGGAEPSGAGQRSCGVGSCAQRVMPEPTGASHLLPQSADSVGNVSEVRLSCGVEAIVPRENGIELVTAQGIFPFSHVICAASPAVAARLLRPLSGMANTVARIERLEHQPIYTLYLQYPPQVRLPHPMIGLHRRCSQWLFDKGQIGGQSGLIAAVISAEGIHQEWPHEVLAEKVTTELREEFGTTKEVLWHKVIAEKRATFCCTPDLQRPSQQTVLPNLLLAGDYTAGDYPATLEGAVQSGLRCAELVF